MTSSLEQLPPELHMAILRSIIDIKTISALVHASPIIHQIYHASVALQQELWTQVRKSTTYTPLLFETSIEQTI